MICPRYKLLFSTSLFAIPTIYGFYNKKYILSSLSLCSMICSMNYWKNPIPGPRKNIDLFVSKTTGVLYFLYGHQNIIGAVGRILGYTNIFMIISFYNASCLLHHYNSDSWEYYHILFHIVTTINKLLVLSY